MTYSGTLLDEVVSWFDNPKQNGTGIMCICPNHQDQQRSLHVSPGRDDAVVIKCHAGCETEAVLARVGKSFKDLYPPKEKAAPNSKKIASITAYDYQELDGTLRFQSVRRQYDDGSKDFRLRRPQTGGGWIYDVKGIELLPFHLPQIKAAAEGGQYVLVLEGEKDVLRAEAAGYAATTNPTGAGKWRDDYSDLLRDVGVEANTLIPDNDVPGFKHMLQVYRSLQGKVKDIIIVQLLGIPAKGDLSDWLDAGGKIDDLEPLMSGSKQSLFGQAKVISVEELAILAGEEPAKSAYVHSADEQEEIPEFPVDVFPAPMAQYIREGAASINVATDMIAMPMLGFAAGVIGNSCAIALKSKWIERLNLWIAVICEPGSGKSPANDYARAPLDELQRAAYKVYLEHVAEWEIEVAAMKADKKNKEPLPEKPALEHFFTTDATTEALSRILAYSPGVTIMRDELVGWVKSFDAYRQGGDRQSFLSLWAGSPLKVDRASTGTTYVPHPCVPIVGGIQPDILPDLGEEANRRDGFIERFLMSWPEAKPQRWTDDDVSSGVRWEVDEIFKNLRLKVRPDDGDTGAVFFLTDEAKQVFANWYNENGEIVKTSTGIAAGCYSKYPGQLARIALVIHCLHHPGDRTLKVEAETITKAITVIEYLRRHLMKILPKFAATGSSKTAGLAPRIMRVLNKEDGEWVARRQLRKGLGNSVDAEDINLMLEALATAGKIENRTVPTGARPREESRSLETHNAHMLNSNGAHPNSESNSAYVHIDEGDQEEVRV